MEAVICNQFNDFVNQKENEEKQNIQTAWAVMITSGIVEMDDGCYYLSAKTLKEEAKKFEGVPVDYNHNLEPIGKVLEVKFNDAGITTDSGSEIAGNNEWMCKLEIPDDIDITQHGVSTHFKPIIDKTVNEVNGVIVKGEIASFKFAKFVSVVEKENARYTESQEMINSKKKLDITKNNEKDKSINNINMSENIENKESSFYDEMKNEISEMKNSLSEIKNSLMPKEEMKNSEEEEKPKEEMKNSNDEVISLLKEVIAKLDTKTEMKNSEEDEDEFKNSKLPRLEYKMEEEETKEVKKSPFVSLVGKFNNN